MASERGQASVEWTGLLLLVALALAAAVALAPRVEGRALGAAVAERITCAAGGHCGERLNAEGVHRVPERSTDGLRRSATRLSVPRRIAGAVVRRAWIGCIAYRRYRYERSHPRRLSPFDPMPLRDGAAIANKCLNPYAFLGAP